MDIKVEIVSTFIKEYHLYKIQRILKRHDISDNVKIFLIQSHLKWLEANLKAKELTQKLHDVYDFIKKVNGR